MSLEINSLAELMFGSSAGSLETADDGFKKAIEEALGLGSTGSSANTADVELKKEIEKMLGFNSAYNSIYYNKKSFVAVSPAFEKKLQEDPELAKEIAQKIDDITSGMTGSKYRHTIVIDRRGEITEYTEKPYDRKAAQKELEERREVSRARLRRKAKLDAYFKLLSQMSMKRKLIEQENLKRAQNKRYKVSGARAESIAQMLFPVEPLSSSLFF